MLSLRFIAILVVFGFVRFTEGAWTDTAKVYARCDLYGFLSRSDDGGATFSQIAVADTWTTLVDVDLASVTSSTVLQFSCTGDAAINGFLGQVTYDSIDYATTNELIASEWEVVSGATPAYWDIASGRDPYWVSLDISMFTDKAYWVDIGGGSTTVFQFDFARVITDKVYARCDLYGSLSRSDNRGRSYVEIAAAESWTSLVEVELTDVTRDTKLQFSCTGDGAINGFLGQVTYDGQRYPTTNPITDGVWTIVSGNNVGYWDVAGGRDGWWTSLDISMFDASSYWVDIGVSSTTVFEFDFSQLNLVRGGRQDARGQGGRGRGARGRGGRGGRRSSAQQINPMLEPAVENSPNEFDLASNGDMANRFLFGLVLLLCCSVIYLTYLNVCVRSKKAKYDRVCVDSDGVESEVQGLNA